MEKSCIVVALDGLSDRSCVELGHRTPLQAAMMPNLDDIAARGSSGLYHALCPWVMAPAEAAHFIMLGYVPDEFPGRGYVEALSEGIPFTDEDVVFIASLVKVSRSGSTLVVDQWWPECSPEELKTVCDAIETYKDNYGTVEFYKTRRGGIAVAKGEVSSKVCDADPCIPGMPVVRVEPLGPYAHNPAAIRCANLMNAYIRHAFFRLSSHPINVKRVMEGKSPLNGIVTWGAGQTLSVMPFAEKWGLHALGIANGGAMQGVYKAAGIMAQGLPEEPRPEEEMALKLDRALQSIKDYELVYLHSDVLERASRLKDPLAKVQVLEAVDRGFASFAHELESRPDIIAVIVGGPAALSTGSRLSSGEPSPLVIAGDGLWRDGVQGFDEVHCSRGCLGRVSGTQLMQILLSLLGRSRLWGRRDIPLDLPHYPGVRKPLLLD